jgi:hypothetical protein
MAKPRPLLAANNNKRILLCLKKPLGRWRRLVISNNANERTEWKNRLQNAVDELDKFLVNCADNRQHFTWDYGEWPYDENEGGVIGSSTYDELARLQKTYMENLNAARDPRSLNKIREILIPQWLSGKNK